MRSSSVLVPVFQQPEPGTPLANLPVSLLGCRGTPEYAGFTDLEALKRHHATGAPAPRTAEEPKYVELSLHDLCRLVLLRGFHQVAINPNCYISYVMSEAEIEHVVGMGLEPEPWQQGIPMGGVLDSTWNHPVVQELEKLALTPEMNKSALFEAILKAHLLAPVAGRPEVNNDGHLTGLLKLIPHGDDQVSALIAFTDVPASVRRFGHPNVYYVTLHTSVLCKNVLDSGFDGLCINPDGPHPFWIQATDCDALISGLAIHGDGTHSLPDPSTIEILAPPAPAPGWLLAAFGQAAERAELREIRWLWLQLGDGQPHLAFAVEPWNDRVIAEVGSLCSSLWDRYHEFTPFIDVFPLSMISGREAQTTLVYRQE